MSAPLSILIVGSDPQLKVELDSVLATRGEQRTLVHTVTDYRLAGEAARSRRPRLVVVEMRTDLAALQQLAEEVTAASPESVIAGAFRPELFGHDTSESVVLIAALRAGVRDFLRRPVSAVDFGQLLDRLARPERIGPVRQGRLVSMISNKGGVGKSTLAVNVALSLAQQFPERVLLVDASLQMGVCAAMLDLNPQYSLADVARQRGRLDELLLRQLTTGHSAGLHLLAAPPDAMESTDIDEELMTRVLSLARRTYDYVIVDTFPALDSVVMAVLDLSDMTYVVLENVVPTVLGAVKLLKLLDAVGYPAARQKIVINRFSSRGGSLRSTDVADRLRRTIDHVVPFDPKVIAAANLGEPLLARSRPFSRTARRMRALVAEVQGLADRPVAEMPQHAMHHTNGTASAVPAKESTT